MRIPPGQSLRTGVAMLLALLLVAGCASKGARARKEKAEAQRRRTVLLTTADDVRIGAESAKAVEADIGLLDDPELTEYVSKMGQKLLRGLPRRDFAYKFSIVDQMEPNAFALPGGHIYVSRGLLALVNNEDELACVLGHEITHAAKRHSAQQQAIARAQSPLSLPISRAATLRAYSRDMEREADAGGQRLCAAAGYDPMGMSTFLRSLDQRERLLLGFKRAPSFLDTHPGSRERAAANSARASELRWRRDPSLGDVRSAHLDRIDGMVIGDRPEAGMFLGDVFVHPSLGFEITFPRGWSTQNSAQAVGAVAPRREAAVYLTADLPKGDLVELADEWSKKAAEEQGVTVTERKRVRLGSIKAVRYGYEAGGGARGVTAKVTFFPFANTTWRLVGVAPSAAADRYFGPILLSMRSFGPISDEHRVGLTTQRLRIVAARPGEDVVRLSSRTENVMPASNTALLNGMRGNETFDGGELMKILRQEEVVIPKETGVSLEKKEER